ncbi:MAG: hypothetical protein RLZZ546_3239 [Bacteroidota bacterium]|jgi:hypothetical protein
MDVDSSLLTRFYWFEHYYEKSYIKEPNIFKANYEAIKNINMYVQKEKLELDDVLQAVKIYNNANVRSHHDGTGWLDLSWHLKTLAKIFGKNYELDKSRFLIENSGDF